MNTNKLINVNYQSEGRATEKAMNKLIKSVVSPKAMITNGTAVEGVCVTGVAIRQPVPVVWQGTVPVASRYGAIFAITVRVGFITIAV